MADNAFPAHVIRFRVLGSLDLQRPGTGELRALLVQPKRLALFAYLLLARPARLHRRDSLLALFWPESAGEQARRSLRQALHFLRQSLGGDVLASRGDEEVGVTPGAVWCDVREFERALDDGRPDEALALYRGPMLDGFHVAGVSPELGQWIEAERARVHARAVEAATLLIERAAREANAPLEIQRVRELLRLDPAAEAALRRLMTLLDRAGDRAGALRAYEELARRLETDVGAEPSRASVALAERIRAGRTSGAQATIAAPAAEFAPPDLPARRLAAAHAKVSLSLVAPAASGAPATAAPTPDVGAPARRHVARWIVARALVGVAAIVAAGAWWRSVTRDAAEPAPLVLAVGIVGDREHTDTATSARVLRDLLATDLARVPGVTVVSGARLQELLVRAPSGQRGRPAVLQAARSAGAAEVLEGELYRRSESLLRLDVRRVAVKDGVIQGAYTVEGPDLFAVVERLSGAIATAIGTHAPSPGLGRVTTTSLTAWRLYGEGRRAAFLGDLPGSLRLLEAALQEDSTFAMAAFWAARVAGRVDGNRQLALLAQAMRASRRAPADDRLRIRLAWALATNDPASVDLADTLARHGPHDLEAALNHAEALIFAAQYGRALPILHAVVARDTAPVTGATPDDAECTACLALSDLAYVYTALDSTDRAARMLQAWARLRPRSADPWAELTVMMTGVGRTRDAERAWERWQALAPATPALRLQRVQRALRVGSFAEADALLEAIARDGGLNQREEVSWWQVISFRMQGRLDAALQAALRHRAQSEEVSDQLPQAQVLLERGRARESAQLFEVHAALSLARIRASIPEGAPDAAPGMQARAVAWPLTHAASAYAMLGDTARLAVLADSIERLGAREAHGRDRRLHHHVRGLLWRARGRPDEAMGEFRRAIVSPTLGYTRTNLELGRLLTSAGRPREAIAVLSPALRGDLQASNYYVTQTELHEALAEAFEQASMPDSARVHWRWVASAWRAADAPFRERAARAQAHAGTALPARRPATPPAPPASAASRP